MRNFAFESATFGFETAKDILGVGPNTMAKLIDLNLIDVMPNEAEPRNLRYAGWSIGNLVVARNRPLQLAPGEKALIASVGVEQNNVVPSPYLDATWGKEWCQDALSRVFETVDAATEALIRERSLRVTGYWRVGKDNVDFLVENRSVFLASYAGFLLEGGRIADCVEGVTNESGGRCFLIEPFNKQERYLYTRTFLAPRQGPMCKVWTAEELVVEADNLD